MVNMRKRWIYLVAGWGLSITPAIATAQQLPKSAIVADVSEAYQLAAAAYQRGDWSESIRRFDQALELPQLPTERLSTLFFRGEALLQANYLTEARGSFQQFLLQIDSALDLSLRPQIQTARFRIAQIALSTNDNNAVHLLETFLQEFPESEFRCEALSALGERRIARKEYRLARRVFETALLEFPHDTKSDLNRYGLSVCLVHLGEFSAAEKFLQFLDQHSSDLELRRRCRLQLAIVETNRQNHNAAVGILEALSQEYSKDRPRQAEVEYWLATNELMRQQDRQALALYARAVKDLVDIDLQAAATFNQALLLVKTGNYVAAEQAFEQVQRRFAAQYPIETWLPPRVEAAFSAANHQSVLQLTTWPLSERLTVDQRRRLLELRGRTQYQLGEFNLASESFERAVQNSTSGEGSWDSLQYLLGLSRVGEQRWNEAQAALNQIVVERWPVNDWPTLQMLQGDIAVRLGDADAAFRHYLLASTQAASLNRNDQQRLFEHLQRQAIRVQDPHWADSLWNQRLIQSTVPGLDRVGPVESEPTPDDGLFSIAQQIGDLAFQQQAYELANQYYRRMRELATSDSDRARALAGLGWTAWELNQREQAQEYFRELGRLAPSSPYYGQAAIILAQAAMTSQDYPQAILFYEQALRGTSDPKKRHSIQWGLAGALKRTRLEVDRLRAIEILEGLRREQSTDLRQSQIIYELAWLYREHQDWPRSIQLFEQLVADYPQSATWSDAAYRLAQHYFQNGQHDTADRLIADILSKSLSPALLSRVQYLAGQVASVRRDWVSACGLMEAASRSADDDRTHQFRCQYWQAESLYQMQRYGEAENLYRSLTATTSQNAETDESLVPWIYLRWSQCLCLREAWEESIEVSSIGMERFQDFAWSFEFEFVLGRAYFAIGKSSDALRAFQLVLDSPAGRRTETAAQAQWRIGEIYFHQERYVEAIDAYYRVDALFAYDHWRAAALLQAGKCQELLGNWQHAIKLYSQIVEKYPQSEFAGPATQRLEIAKRQAQLETGEAIR